MLYIEFINRVKEETIYQADNGLWYLEPEWAEIIKDAELTCSDRKLKPEQIEDVLKLEVEKRNTIMSNKPFVINWLYELITTTVEPSMLKEETDLIKKMIESRKPEE